MEFNLLRAIRELLNQLTEDDFENLVVDHFRDAQSQLDGSLSNKIKKLLDFAQKHRRIQKLLEAVEEINPDAYSEYKDKITVPPRPGKSEPEQVPKEPKIATGSTCDILILSANPRGTDPLKLEDEAERIRKELQGGQQRYVVKAERAVRVEDLSKYLLKYNPIILHFSGHGSPDGEIILENEQQQPQNVSAEALAGLFSGVQGRTECVVLNACYSLERADALAEHVGCVIGMTEEIDDDSALRFAVGFYRGLAFGKGYYAAFELGRKEIPLMNLPDAEVPHFFTREGMLDSEAVKPRVKRTSTLLTEKEQQTATKYPLWFGTNRCPIEPNDLSKGFSGERDNQIHYGTCKVTVPKSHKIGETGSSWWKRLVTLTDDRLRLDTKSLSNLTEAIFWTHVTESLREHNTGERMALVFIHGFNVSFENAALRAAQIGFDLQVPGITAFYSWPSKGKLTGYAADESSIEASEPYIAEFLSNFAEKSGAEQIHIIAHSMGNRGLLRSMQRILHQAETKSNVSFGQIFLAAPDVDIDVFKNLAAALGRLSRRTTLYLSSKDKALATSGIIHDYPRAGFCPPRTVVTGIDTVEVTNIDLTFLGHSYYADARDVLQDMHTLLVHNSPPDKRFGMRLIVTSPNEKYWVIGK